MERLIQIVLINFLNEVPSNDVLERNPIQIFDIKLYTCKHVLTGFTQTALFLFFVLKIFTQRLTSAHQNLFAQNKHESVTTVLWRLPYLSKISDCLVFGPWNNFDPRLRVCHHLRKRQLHQERQLEHLHQST